MAQFDVRMNEMERRLEIQGRVSKQEILMMRDPEAFTRMVTNQVIELVAQKFFAEMEPRIEMLIKELMGPIIEKEGEAMKAEKDFSRS